MVDSTAPHTRGRGINHLAVEVHLAGVQRRAAAVLKLDHEAAFAVDARGAAAAGGPRDLAAEEGIAIRSLPGTPYARASVGAWNDESDLERLLAAL